MSAIAVVVTPLEGGTPVEGICRDRFVAHRIALTRMESLICELHLPELNEPSEQSPVQAHLAQQRMSRAGPQLGSVPSLGISALYDSVPSRVSRAELALLALPSLLAANILPRSENRMSVFSILNSKKRNYDVFLVKGGVLTTISKN